MYSDNLEKLMELIKEGQDLSYGTNTVMPGFAVQGDVEPIPGTDYYLKKGKLEEFNSRAYIYYKEYLESNGSFLKEGTSSDVISKEVYELLSKEIREEDNEYYNTKAYELYEGNKTLINQLDELEKSSRNVNERYNEILQELEAARQSLRTASSTRKANIEANIRSIEEDLEMITNAKDTVTANLAKARSEINANFIKAVEDQLNVIRNNYFQASKINNIYFGEDGRPILGGDLEEYNALLKLLSLANEADLNNSTTLVNGCVCLNNNQVAEAENLINKTNLFKKLKKQEPVDIINATNDKLINQITAELRKLEEAAAKSRTKIENLKSITTTITRVRVENGVEVLETEEIEIAKVLPKDYDEYVRLFTTLKALNKVKNSYVQKLTNVWGIAYIDINDVASFKFNFPLTNIFNNINPQIPQQQKNQELIDKLKKYIEDRAKEAEEESKNSGRNIDIRRINVDGIDLLVKGEAYPECIRLANIISLIKSANSIDLKQALANPDIKLTDIDALELKDVMGLAYVPKADAAKLEELIKSSAYFGFTEPVIIETPLAEQIKDKYEQILALVKKTQGVSPSLIDKNGLVLISDYDKYDSLVDQYISLCNKQNVRENPNEYRIELETLLKNQIGLIVPSVDNPLPVEEETPIEEEKDFTLTDDLIEKVSEKITEWQNANPDTSAYTNEDFTYFTNLLEQLRILRGSKDATNLVKLNGIYIDAEKEEKYKGLVNQIAEYEANHNLNNNENQPQNEAKIAELEAILDSYPDDLSSEQTAEYNAYEELKDIIEEGLTADNTILIDNLKIPADKEQLYYELRDKIAELSHQEDNNPPQVSVIEQEIEFIKKEMDKFNITLDSPIIDQIIYNNQKKILNILEKSLNSTNLKSLNEYDFEVDEAYVEETERLINEINKITENARNNDIKMSNIEALLNDSSLSNELKALYNEQHQILNEAITTNRMTTFKTADDGTMVASSKLKRYNEIITQIKDYKETQGLSKANLKEIEAINEKLAALEEEAKDLAPEETATTSIGTKVAKEDLEEYELLLEKRDIIKRAPHQINDKIVNVRDEDTGRYAAIVIELTEIEDAKSNKDGLSRSYLKAEEELRKKPRREKITIRKAGIAVLKAIRNSIGTIMAGGLGIAAAYLAGHSPIGAALGTLGFTAVLVNESRHKAEITRNSDYGFGDRGVGAFRNFASNYDTMLDMKASAVDVEIIEDADLNPDDAELQAAAEQSRKNIEERFNRLRELADERNRVNASLAPFAKLRQKPSEEEEDIEELEPPVAEQEPPIVVSVPNNIDDILQGLQGRSLRADLEIHKKIKELQDQIDSGTLDDEELRIAQEEIGKLLKQFSDASLGRQEINFAIQDVYITYDKIRALRDTIIYAAPEQKPLYQSQLDALIASLNSVSNINEIIAQRFSEVDEKISELENDPFRENDIELDALKGERDTLSEIQELIAASRTL